MLSQARGFYRRSCRAEIPTAGGVSGDVAGRERQTFDFRGLGGGGGDCTTTTLIITITAKRLSLDVAVSLTEGWKKNLTPQKLVIPTTKGLKSRTRVNLDYLGYDIFCMIPALYPAHSI